MALLVVGVLAGLVPILGLAGPDEVAVSGTPVAAESSPVAVQREKQAEQQAAERKAATERKAAAEKKAAAAKRAEQTKTPGSEAPSGPKIDPEDNERADNERTRNKLIVGAITVVLGLIVFSGHRARAQRKKKIKDQAKGK